jgi:hypothetical protein
MDRTRRGSLALRAQISLEYLVIIGVALGLLLPGVYFFFFYSKSSIEGTTSTRLNDIGLKMLSTAKGSYALGAGARQTIDLVMPDAVTGITISRTGGAPGAVSELVFTYDTPYGPSEAVFFSDVKILNELDSTDGNLSTPHSGLTRYQFVSNGQNVSITDVTGAGS